MDWCHFLWNQGDIPTLRIALLAANDRCRMEGRRTLAAEDLLAAMRSLGLDQYHDVLRDYVIKYREVSCT